MYRQLYYTLVTKYRLHFSVKKHKKEGGKHGSKPKEQHWAGICRMRNPARGKRTPIADSLIKTILLKRELLRRLGSVCVPVLTQDTHSPLSLSHYQLAFHPVSHPSVQMVRKAASVFLRYHSPFSLHTLLWRRKKKKKKKVMPVIDWSQRGEGYRLDVRWI